MIEQNRKMGKKWIKERLRDFYQAVREEWIMRHILSSEGGLLLPVGWIAQNNPESEYKQYCTRIGVECELATESASRPTVRGGESIHAAYGQRLRGTTQSVGQPILTWIVKWYWHLICVHIDTLTHWHIWWYSRCRGQEHDLRLRPEAVTRQRAELRCAAEERGYPSWIKVEIVDIRRE